MEDRYELTAQQIAANLEEVRGNIEAACRRAGRNPDSVQLCAVSKKKSVADIRAAMAAGQRLFGENYVQELREKTQTLGSTRCGNLPSPEPQPAGKNLPQAEEPQPAEVEPSDGAGEASALSGTAVPGWHMIGHLQRNKVKYIVDTVEMIESVDSLALAQQIEKEAAKKDLVADVLLEVNIAQEESKWGFAAEEALPAAKEIGEFPHVRVRGFMTSAPYTEDAETNRIHFRNLRKLFDELGAAGYPGVQADTLSMGMTGDYIVAVEEGATLVRVGTGVFGQRDYGAAG